MSTLTERLRASPTSAIMLEAASEIDLLRAALQGLLDALPSATTHPAIKAARAALTQQETEE